MINKFTHDILNAALGGTILQISFSDAFSKELYVHDTRPFDFVKSTFAGVPYVIREQQAAPFLITIQGGKK